MKKTLFYSMLILCSLQSCSSKDEESIKILTTTTSREQDLSVSYAPFNGQTTGNCIQLDKTVRYQTIDGFGAAITGSSAYNLSLMPAAKRDTFLRETFSPDKFGFNYIRVPIGCSDFSLSDYTCCDKEGIENFALTTEETKYIIPVIKEILKINPALKIMGTPWTCPKWMKIESLDNPVPYNSWTGGQLNPKYYQDYAVYFAKWTA